MAIFTREEFLRRFARNGVWGDEVEVGVLLASDAVSFALQCFDANPDNMKNVVVNPNNEKQLVLERYELQALAAGTPIPLVDYAIAGRVEDGEVWAYRAPQSVPPGLAECLHEIMTGLPESCGCELQESFCAERDLAPVLTVEFWAKPAEHAATLKQRARAILGHPSAPFGRLRVRFKADS
jgi:hypothetical protein